MAWSLQVVFLLSLTSGPFIAGAVSQAAEPDSAEEVPVCPPGCPPGWTQSEKRCFIFYMKPKTWADAEAACLKIGGNLASVHNSDENKFLVELVERAAGRTKVRTWIGGNDAVQEKKWFWTDGTELDYQVWNTKQPDNYRNEHCMEMNHGGPFWNDNKCNKAQPYVCAKDAQITPR